MSSQLKNYEDKADVNHYAIVNFPGCKENQIRVIATINIKLFHPKHITA